MRQISPQNPGFLNWCLITVLGIIWGCAFLSVSVALNGFPPWTVAAIRVGVAALALLAIGAILGQGLRTIPSLRAWGYAGAIGLGAVALPFALLSWGQQFVPSAFAGIAMGAVPLLVLPLVYLFSPEEGIGPRRVMGLLLGFVGIYLMIGPQAVEASGAEAEHLGRLACITAAGCYAAGSVVTRRAPKMPPIAFATGSTLIAAIVLIPIALISDGWPSDWPLTPSIAVLYAALFPTALAAIIRVHVITTAGSLFMSLTSYMVPVWSVIFGVILLDEQLSAALFVALSLILAGIAISQSRAIAGLLRRG